MPFQPGNRRQSVFAPRATFYALVAGSGVQTINVPRTFKPYSPVIATPAIDAPSGYAVNWARLLPPASGSYASGAHPRLNFSTAGGGSQIGVTFIQA